jgi:hypothetical protein
VRWKPLLLRLIKGDNGLKDYVLGLKLRLQRHDIFLKYVMSELNNLLFLVKNLD